MTTVRITKTQFSYAIVEINNPPVNALTTELWTDLTAALAQCEQDSAIRGIVICSGLEKDIFSAGNDLLELYAPKTSKERFTQFWTLQTTFLARLYRSPLVTIACIRGYAPAGACAIALCCDYRIMTSNECVKSSKMGLNEVAIGIMVPKFWSELYLKQCGSLGKAEVNLLFARILNAKECLDIGLVHELVNSRDDLLKVANGRMSQFLKFADTGRQVTKQTIRERFSSDWEAFGPQEAAIAWESLKSPQITSTLGKAMQALMGPKSKM